MANYTIIKNEFVIHVFGNNQEFTQEDRDDLWSTHKILYLDGIMAVWVQDRGNINPLIHLMYEDDGHLGWSMKNDVCFDVAWIDDYVETLLEVKERIRGSYHA